jgi:carbon monoxide dehydrogenase subunit G
VELTNEFRVSVPVADAWGVLTDVERIAPCLPGAQLQEIEGDEYRGIVKVKVGPITAQYKGKATFQTKDDDAHIAVLKAEGRDTRGQGNASATITATLTADGDGTAVKVVTDLTITGKVAQFGRGVLVDVSGKLLNQFVDCLENDLLSGTPSASSSSAASASPPHGDPLMEAAGDKAPATAPAESEPKPAPAKAAATKKTAAKTAAESAKTATATTPATAPAASNGTGTNGQATPAASGAPATSGQPSGKPGSAEGAPAAQSEVRKIQQKMAEPVDLLDAAGVPVAKRAIPAVAGILLILWFLRRRRRRSR